jgi:hypothetical protein
MTPARRHRERVMSDQRKPRGLARFREREVTRITKAVRVAGGGKVTLDPETGQYTILVASKGEVSTDNASGNDLDNWMATRGKDARSA